MKKDFIEDKSPWDNKVGLLIYVLIRNKNAKDKDQWSRLLRAVVSLHSVSLLLRVESINGAQIELTVKRVSNRCCFSSLLLLPQPAQSFALLRPISQPQVYYPRSCTSQLSVSAYRQLVHRFDHQKVVPVKPCRKTIQAQWRSIDSSRRKVLPTW